MLPGSGVRGRAWRPRSCDHALDDVEVVAAKRDSWLLGIRFGAWSTCASEAQPYKNYAPSDSLADDRESRGAPCLDSDCVPLRVA